MIVVFREWVVDRKRVEYSEYIVEDTTMLLVEKETRIFLANCGKGRTCLITVGINTENANKVGLETDFQQQD